MNADNYGWIELLFVGAVALGFGGWQLWSVNREIAKDKARKGKDKPDPGSVRPD